VENFIRRVPKNHGPVIEFKLVKAIGFRTTERRYPATLLSALWKKETIWSN
jgi:hypothetical protein